MNIEEALAAGHIHQVGTDANGDPIYEGVFATKIREELVEMMKEETNESRENA